MGVSKGNSTLEFCFTCEHTGKPTSMLVAGYKKRLDEHFVVLVT